MNLLTPVHVAISLIGILSGLVVVLGFLSAKRLDSWNAIFLITTVLTSATGFLFPLHKLLPSHILGILSLVVLAVALFARYSRSLTGGWRRTYVIAFANRAVLQCVCADRAVVPESTNAEGAGANAVGAAFCGGASCVPAAFRRADHHVGDQVSAGGGAGVVGALWAADQQQRGL